MNEELIVANNRFFEFLNFEQSCSYLWFHIFSNFNCPKVSVHYSIAFWDFLGKISPLDVNIFGELNIFDQKGRKIVFSEIRKAIHIRYYEKRFFS